MTHPNGDPRWQPLADPWASRAMDIPAQVPTPQPPAAMVEARGQTGRVVFDGATVTIHRESRLARMAGTEAHLSLFSMRAAQLKKGWSGGELRFDMADGTDPTACRVLFNHKQQPAFVELHRAVETALAHRGPLVATPTPPPTPTSAPAGSLGPAMDDYLRQATKGERLTNRLLSLTFWLIAAPLIAAFAICVAGLWATVK